MAEPIENAKALLADGDGHSGAGALAMALENLVEYAEKLERENAESRDGTTIVKLAEAEAAVAEALAIEEWPYRPDRMQGFELDQAEGCNEVRQEFRRILSVARSATAPVMPGLSAEHNPSHPAGTQTPPAPATEPPARRTIRLEHLLGAFVPGSGDWGWATESDLLHGTAKLDWIMTSVQETGIQEPILLGADGRVWDGHHRVVAAMQLGIDGVPVVFSQGWREQ